MEAAISLSTPLRRSLLLAVIASSLLLVACSDDAQFFPDLSLDSKGAGLEASIKPDQSNLPDGYTLYSCSNPGKACNAHDPCAINPICSWDKKCVPESLMDCSDKLSCTTDTCAGLGVCVNLPKAGWCKLLVQVGGPPLDGGAVDAGASTVDYGAAQTVFKCFKDGDKKPGAPCMACSSSSSDIGVASDPTKWSPVSGGACDDYDSCTQNDYCQNGTCKGTSYKSKCADSYACTDDKCDGKGGCLGNPLKSDWCLINSVCYKAKAAHPSGGCFTCVPTTSQSSWTAISNTCLIGGKCYAKGALNPVGCGECDPTASTTAWTVKGTTCCLISGVKYVAGAKTTDGCSICDPKTSTTAWTLLTTICKIASKCYQKGAKNPKGCAECDPAASQTSWTVKGSYCYIKDTCYNPAAKDPSGCATCDPTKNKYGWSPIAGQCKINGVCHANGKAHPEGCAKCDTTKSQTSWTVSKTGYCVANYKCYPLCGGKCIDLSKDPLNCGTCGNACTGKYVCKNSKCVAPCVVVGGFEDGKWPSAGWTYKATGGSVTAAAAHDGKYGLMDPGWHYALGTTAGAVGDTITAWVRQSASATGRVYLGFSASTSHTNSLVLATNTKALFFYGHANYSSYTTIGSSKTMTFASATWYKMEIKFLASKVVQGTIYKSDGKTVLGTQSATFTGTLTGGVAIRGFGSHHIDSITICK